ncbi:transposase [Gracilibacillus sp. YIM 98692]|uniref:transposase n=1 Tax=Gracilibacillus sp. YIM 98692 TaxID=2663532 RepID=UPI0013D8D73B|nr:transposase [Gracilibacillus sp. YIM 98692]
MMLLIIMGSIFVLLFMFALKKKWPKSHLIYHGIALISALIFGNISALTIYRVIRDNAVFMTKVHGIFLNPFFLITGAYLGVYFLYLIASQIHKEWS